MVPKRFQRVCFVVYSFVHSNMAVNQLPYKDGLQADCHHYTTSEISYITHTSLQNTMIFYFQSGMQTFSNSSFLLLRVKNRQKYQAGNSRARGMECDPELVLQWL